MSGSLQGALVQGVALKFRQKTAHHCTREHTIFPLGLEAVFSKHLKEFLTSSCIMLNERKCSEGRKDRLQRIKDPELREEIQGTGGDPW